MNTKLFILCTILMLLSLNLFAQQNNLYVNHSVYSATKGDTIINQTNAVDDTGKTVISGEIDNQQDMTTVINDFIILNDSSSINTKFEVNKPMFGDIYFTLENGTEILGKEVQAFKKDSSYSARVEGTNDFAERIIKGKIDLYREYITSYYSGGWSTISTPHGSSQVYSGGGSQSYSYDYFSKDGSPVMDASYSNLKQALADNSESMQYLSTYNTMGILKWGSIVVGVGVIVAALVGADKDNPPGVGGILIGAAIANLSWIFSGVQSSSLESAIEVYNR